MAQKRIYKSPLVEEYSLDISISLVMASGGEPPVDPPFDLAPSAARQKAFPKKLKSDTPFGGDAPVYD